MTNVTNFYDSFQYSSLFPPINYQMEKLMYFDQLNPKLAYRLPFQWPETENSPLFRDLPEINNPIQ